MHEQHASDVRRLLPMPTAIGLMHEAFSALSAGTADVPVRTPIATPGGASALSSQRGGSYRRASYTIGR